MTVEAPDLIGRRADTVDRQPIAHDTYLSAEAFLSLGCMEGILDPIVTEDDASKTAAPSISSKPGYVLAACIAGLAYLLHYAPIAPFTVVNDLGAIVDSIAQRDSL